jgi:hypothetical protein
LEIKGGIWKVQQVKVDMLEDLVQVFNNQDDGGQSDSSVILDGLLLLAASKTDEPSLVTAAWLESINLDKVISEDLAIFTNLTYLDLADNFIKMEDLSLLPALIELHLPCNGIRDIKSSPTAFQHLQVIFISNSKFLSNFRF